MEAAYESYFGHVCFGAPETVEITSPRNNNVKSTATRWNGCWRPPERLQQYLPEGYSIPLQCHVGSDGLRRIAFACNFEELISVGAAGGLAVIHGFKGFDAHRDHSYRSMHLILQHVRGRGYRGESGVQAPLARSFRFSRDLYVRLSGRTTDADRDILPDDVGLTADGRGNRWSVSQLTERGRRAARDAGYVNPTNEHAIHFGLFEAARLNPLVVEPERVKMLVRMALFDFNSAAEPPGDEVLEWVEERLLTAINNHIHHDSLEDFERWFYGENNSVLKQVAQQRRRPGGKLDREAVRNAFLHLCWRAYRYTGDCVHALVRTIQNAITDLAAEEKLLFEKCTSNKHVTEVCPRLSSPSGLNFYKKRSWRVGTILEATSTCLSCTDYSAITLKWPQVAVKPTADSSLCPRLGTIAMRIAMKIHMAPDLFQARAAA